jgi:3-oxoacyl-[acyl-carrier-protein] synthase III
MHFSNVAIESVVYDLPPHIVTSGELEDRLAEVTARLKLPANPIQPLTGIAERRFWDEGVPVHQVAARAARRAIAAAGIEPEQVGLLINTSICKDFLEPSMASLIHGDVGLEPECMNFDLANACLGFMNGIEVAGRMIDAGLVDYALLVDGESARDVVESTVRCLLDPETTAQDFWDSFATLTLGSAAVAMVLARADLSWTLHRVNGCVTLADTTQNRLSVGTAERMVTDSTHLMKTGVNLAKKTWTLASDRLAAWSPTSIGQFICHQVGHAHMAALSDALGIDLAKCFLTYPQHGNVGPAAVPLTLAMADEAGRLRPGDHVALMGIGSGLNVTMMSVTW